MIRKCSSPLETDQTPVTSIDWKGKLKQERKKKFSIAGDTLLLWEIPDLLWALCSLFENEGLGLPGDQCWPNLAHY